MECVRHCGTRVAGSGDQNGELFVLRFAKMEHELRHEARPDILEGECRSPEELEAVDALLYPDEGHRESEAGLDDLSQGPRLQIVSQQVAGQPAGDLLPARFEKCLDGLRRQRLQPCRHVQPAVGCQSAA